MRGEGFLISVKTDKHLFTNGITIHLFIGQVWKQASDMMSLFILQYPANQFVPQVPLRTGTSCCLSWQTHGDDEEVTSPITMKQLHAGFIFMLNNAIFWGVTVFLFKSTLNITFFFSAHSNRRSIL